MTPRLVRLLLLCALSAATGACTLNVNDDADAGGTSGTGSAGTAGAAGMGGGGTGGSGTGGSGGASGDMSFDDVVGTLGRLPALTAGEVPTGTPTEDRCGAVTHLQRTQNFDQVSVESTHGSALFPGNVVVGSDALEGRLTPVGGTLAPITYSVRIQGAPMVSDTLDVPSRSSYAESLNTLLSNAMSATSPAMLDYKLAAVTSQDDLKNALGGSVGFFGIASFGANFEFSSSTIKSRFVVSFEQTYYSVDANSATPASSFFADDSFPSVTSPPLYIQSIRYGRRVLLFVASEHYEAETKTALNAGFNDVSSGAMFGASASDQERAVYDSMNMHAVVIGGSASSGVMLINDPASLGMLLADGANFGSANPGAPIDFQLAHILDNSQATLSIVSDYDRHSCVDVEVAIELIDSCGDPDCTGEFFGPIHLWVTEDSAVPCGVQRDRLLGVEGIAWSGALQATSVLTVPSGPGRPVCIFGSLGEEDVLSNDSYGLVDRDLLLPTPPMMTVTDALSMTSDSSPVDLLTFETAITVLGPSAGPLP